MLSGSDGSELDFQADDAAISVLLLDSDGDGAIEQYTVDASNSERAYQVVRRDLPASERWRSDWFDDGILGDNLAQVTAVDLDGDGAVELLTPLAVLDAATGTTRFTLPVPANDPYIGLVATMPQAGDLDGDGMMEVFAAGVAYDRDGAVLWSHPRTGLGLWSAMVQADDDPAAEVVQLGSGMVVYDGDGTLLATYEDDPMRGQGPPCMADLDGDGRAEVAIPSEMELWAFELDATPKWVAPMTDSGIAGCSAFDFDADGAAEVVVADEVAITIYDGRTGGIRWTDDRHKSGTLVEYIPIVDVDADGSVELLEVSWVDEGWAVLTAWGQPDKTWPPGGPAWPAHDFSYGNYGDDGEVPRPGTEPSWLVDGGRLRSRPSGTVYGVDLAPELVDDCIQSCDPGGSVQVSLRVANHGLHLATRVVVTVADANAATLATLDFGQVAGATATASQSVDVPVSAFAAGPLNVSVDSPAYDECDASDDAIAIPSPCL